MGTVKAWVAVIAALSLLASGALATPPAVTGALGAAVVPGRLPGFSPTASLVTLMPVLAGRVVTALDLEQGVRGGRVAPVASYPQEEDQELVAVPQPRPVCRDALCIFDSIDPSLLASLAGPPLAKKLANSTAGIDPQIAASKSYLAVSMRDKVWFFDKSGALLNNLDGTAATYPIPLCTLFQGLTPSINANLHLPENQTDADGNAITVKNGYGLNCNAKTGGTRPPNWSYDRDGNGVIDDNDFYWPNDTYYDARLLFDEKDQRFVIGALFINNNTRYNTKDLSAPGSRSRDVMAARRSGYAVAVSSTSDPRHDWFTYWIPASESAFACPQSCTETSNHWEQHGADYTQMGMADDYLVIESITGGGVVDPTADPTTAIPLDLRPGVSLFPLPPFVAGSLCAPCFAYQSRDFRYPDDSLVVFDGFPLEPAVQHATPAGHLLLTHTWIDPDASDPQPYQLIFWDLVVNGSDVTVMRSAKPIRPFVAVGALAPQRTPGGQPNAPMWNLATGTGTGGFATTTSPNWFVARFLDLYITWDECDQIVKQTCTRSGIRFVHLDLSTGSVHDETFGASSIGDPKGTTGWYGLPALEDNKNGDVALVFGHSGAAIYPSAAYTVRYAINNYNPLASRILTAGTYALGTLGGGTCQCWHHYVGAGLDPWDQTGIWVVTGYGTNAGWRYVIARIFGADAPDLTVVGAVLAKVPGNIGRYRVALSTRNQGSGLALPSDGTIALRQAGAERVLARFRTPAIPAGANKTREIPFTLDGLPPAGSTLVITLNASGDLMEYDDQNNTVEIEFSMRGS